MAGSSDTVQEKSATKRKHTWVAGSIAVYFGLIYILGFSNLFAVQYSRADFEATKAGSSTPSVKATSEATAFDAAAYDKRLLVIANNGTTTSSTSPKLWPAPKAAYPKAGAILPNKRIVAYYGNFYSKGMGVLGQYPPAEMLSRLKQEVARWQAADPKTPVVPAIDYIAVTAQGSPGKDGKYRLRMPDSEVDKAVALANQVNGIVILDIQVGLSTLPAELPLYEKYLKMPNVHLAIDPEFSMKNGAKPGSVIGTMSAADVNYAANYLAKLVNDNNLPPKVLIVHRFTEGMVTGYRSIKPLPEVQIVMDMDGWGFAAKKLNTYRQVIHLEPVQFSGFKLFYKNDVKPPSTRMLTPQELLKLSPQPLFIQYQ